MSETYMSCFSFGITKGIAEKIVKREYKENLEKYIDYMQKNKIELITYNNDCYPRKLREIYDSPISIYVSGNKEILNDKSIAIVGCRACTKYGENVAKNFAYKLSMSNINIVSGLARGIDTFSHIGAVLAHGKTTAVIGSGLDIIYPPENKKIYDKIIEENGAIISEYSLRNTTTSKKFSSKKQNNKWNVRCNNSSRSFRKKRDNDYSRFCIGTGKRSICCSRKY